MAQANAFFLVLFLTMITFVLVIFSIVGGVLYFAWELANAVAEGTRRFKHWVEERFRK